MVHARAIALTGSDQAARAAMSVYYGVTIRETAGSTAVVRIYDNASAATGTLLEAIALSANESVREYYPGGVWAENGVYVKIVSGTVEGSVRVG